MVKGVARLGAGPSLSGVDRVSCFDGTRLIVDSCIHITPLIASQPKEADHPLAAARVVLCRIAASIVRSMIVFLGQYLPVIGDLHRAALLEEEKWLSGDHTESKYLGVAELLIEALTANQDLRLNRLQDPLAIPGGKPLHHYIRACHFLGVQ